MQRLFAVLVATLISNVAIAGEWNTNEHGVVLDGHDVVSYRTEDRALKGTKTYAVNYDDAIFYFSSQKNRDLFKSDPAKYAPKYNAYCAFGVGAKNVKVPANPDSFKMYNGELLVFFNDVYQGNKVNTKIPWNADEKTLHQQAEANWQELN